MAAKQRDPQFSLYEITNGHILFNGEETSKKLGCTGQLSVDSKTKTVKKMCEGKLKESKSEITEVDVKFIGHVEKDVLRKVFGIETESLKPGIYAYGFDSKGEKCTLTFDAHDLYKTDKLLMAFPNCSISGGLKFSIKNGEDVVSEIELDFIAASDDNGNFYYEAFESELEEEVKTKWHTKFTPSELKAN